MPWAISLLAPRNGWAGGRPGPWNLPGLILVIAGTAGLIWTLYLHFAQSRAGIEWVLDKSYMLSSGPYAFSRHPMYLSELTLFLGWTIFYGSIADLTAFAAALAAFNFFAVPAEERVLEARFGQAYREYKSRVRRWL
jgi:protein-S-isoprenylcysteine O-methyltransferase Ste14